MTGKSKERGVRRLLPSSLIEKVESGQVSLYQKSFITDGKICAKRIESQGKRER